jgi:cytidylate kinase
MKPAADAALIDTTGMTVDQVVEELVDRTLGVR